MRKEIKMKKALSLILSLILILTALTSLAACSKTGDAPEGMQLVRGGEDVGYYMYAPEEWMVANQDELGIACSYVSKVNNTSVTLVEGSFTAENVAEYVAAELAKFPLALAMTETLKLKPDALGNASKAWKTSYTYKYGDFEYRVLQIFAIYSDRSYIFTYSASTGTYDGEVSYYDKFLEQAEAVISNIKFVDKVASESDTPTYEKDRDGYSLVSDKKLAGFAMYIPDTYTLDFASSIVSATRADGTNVNVSEATDTNTDSVGYWTTRFATLEKLGATVKLLDPEKEDITSAQVAVSLGDGVRATSLKYSVTFGGEVRNVYQVLIVKGMNGYVFTYSANEAIFESNLAEAQTILNKIEF